jgi:arsenate reductase
MDEEKATLALSALAQPTRLRVFRRLVRAGQAGLPAGEIADGEAVPHNTMSTHLAILVRAGLLRSRRDSRSMIYAVNLAGTRAFLTYLVSDCCGGRPEFCVPLVEIAEQMTAAYDRYQPLAEAGEGRVFNVLFLCTANSARSIMAEVVLNELGRGRFRGFSAGSHPAAKPMPAALARLRGLGHDVSGVRSKSWQEFLTPGAPRMDFVIALCDILEGQSCPEFGRNALTVSWALPDPAKFSGDAAERATMFNELYASLRRRIEIFINLPLASLDRRALRARLDQIGGGRVAALEKGRVL